MKKTNFLYVMEKSSREGKSLIVFEAQWKNLNFTAGASVIVQSALSEVLPTQMKKNKV